MRTFTSHNGKEIMQPDGETLFEVTGDNELVEVKEEEECIYN